MCPSTITASFPTRTAARDPCPTYSVNMSILSPLSSRKIDPARPSVLQIKSTIAASFGRDEGRARRRKLNCRDLLGNAPERRGRFAQRHGVSRIGGRGVFQQHHF